MRDLVIPSFAAARLADARFAETRKRLPHYAEIAADEIEHNTVVRESELSRLSIDASFLLQETLIIKKALDDSRLSSNSKDPLIQMERTQVQQVYEAQETRADLLNEFVQRESMSLAIQRVGMEDSGGLAGKRSPQRIVNTHSDSHTAPAATAAPGMPLLIGLIAMADRSRLAEWGATAALAVRDQENHAAQSFLSVARDCRDLSR